MDTLTDPDNIVSEFRRIRGSQESQDHGETQENQISGELIWQEELLEIAKNIWPGAFERLCQRLLREAGFINVKVTGQSGDGGIDGTGVLKINRMVSFHVYFQAKRYRDAVPASVVRNFRGAMVGRAGKGMIITTGRFTRDAQGEAYREGADPVDLIDGIQLKEMLRDFEIGIETEEIVRINNDYFESL